MDRLLVLNQELRQRLAERIGKGAETAARFDHWRDGDDVTVRGRDVDVLVTYNEINERHGTGVLLTRIFGGCRDVVSIRTLDSYGGEHSHRDSFRLPYPAIPRRDAYDLVQCWFRGATVRRVLCVPYSAPEVSVALALSYTYDAPLATWIMDDQNVGANGIPDTLMEELLARSRLRLAISPEMRVAYENKYWVKFWMLPPLVSGTLIAVEPAAVPIAGKRAAGILVGNVWGQHWLDRLRKTVRGSGIRIDWYCNAGTAPSWLRIDQGDLGRDGITIHEPLPEPELAHVLRQYSFALVPSGTLDSLDDNHTVARLSLPTRVPFIVAASNTPIVVLGHADSAVARFVTRFGVGVVSSYDVTTFRDAVAQVSRTDQQRMMRRKAVEIAEGFRGDGIRDWIWSALANGQPADPRFERLLPPDPSEFAYFVEAPIPAEVWRDFRAAYRALERLRRTGFQPDFVLDIGASTGVWSHSMNRLFPRARFLLVDPLFSKYDSGRHRHYVGQHENFEVIEVAVSNRSGRARLSLSKNLYGSSLICPAEGQWESLEVEVTTLDHLFERRQVLGRGLLKIDVQHAEHLVLEGSSHTLNYVDVVILELTLTGVPEGAKSLPEMLNEMDRLGFKYVDDAGEWRSPADGTLMEKDLVFIRKGLSM